MTQLAGFWWPEMASAALQGTVIALIALFVISFRRAISAPARHAVLLIALARFAVLSGLTLLPFGIRSEIDIARWTSSQPRGWMVSLAFVYLAGCFVTLTVLIARYRRLQRLARSAAVVESGEVFDVFRATSETLLHRTPHLLITEEAVAPMSFGVFRRCVLVSRGLLDQLDAQRLRTVFAHELVHHRRGDLIVSHLQAWLTVCGGFIRSSTRLRETSPRSVRKRAMTFSSHAA